MVQSRRVSTGSSERSDSQILRSVEFGLDGFAWEALSNEAEREGLTVEELVTFAVLYYLADVDSGRISRRISLSPFSRTGQLADETPPDARRRE